MKHLFLKYSWLPVLLILTACWKEPSYPKEPSISYSSITQKQTKDKLDNPVIEVQLAVNFQDGDGNLGLGTSDTLAPFNDVAGNKFKNNYFVEPYIKYPTDSDFRLYTPLISYNGRFMRLAPDNGTRALEGELRYSFTILPGFDLQDGDMMKFRIHIADRSLNLSNTIETEPITLDF